MSRFLRILSAILVLCVLATMFASCFSKDSFENGTTEEETQNQDPNSKSEGLSRITSFTMSSQRYCAITVQSEASSENEYVFKEVTRILYKTERKSGEKYYRPYSELSAESVKGGRTIWVDANSNEKLVGLILVFKKNCSVTTDEKEWMKKNGIEYMFEP